MSNAVIALSVILTVFLSSAVYPCSAGDQGNFDVCVSVTQRDSPRVDNNNTAQANRPGKMGPRGPRGFKGDVGPPGSCVCDQQRMDEMQSEIDRLQDFYREMKPSMTLFKFNQNPETCSVGVKSSDRVPDSALTSSSMHANHRPHGARFARLDNPQRTSTNQGSWVAGKAQTGEWIQVDLGSPTQITGIVTQGRKHYDQWITSFRISYGNSTNSLRFIQDGSGGDKIFAGNKDRESYKMNLFVPDITARYFRLYVVTFHNHASLRMEYLDC